jgi:hypothetical protein
LLWVRVPSATPTFSSEDAPRAAGLAVRETHAFGARFAEQLMQSQDAVLLMTAPEGWLFQLGSSTR